MLTHRRAAIVVASSFLFSSAFAATTVSAQEPNPIEVKVKTSLKDPNKPFTMVIRLETKPGMHDKFEKAFAKAILGTRKEKGNIAYDLNRDSKKANRYLVYERWRSLAALQAHLKTPHITTLLAELGDLLAGEPEVLVFVPAGERK